MNEDSGQGSDHSADEATTSWRELVDGSRLTIDALLGDSDKKIAGFTLYFGDETRKVDVDDAVRTDLAHCLLRAALEARGSADPEGEKRYTADAESLLRIIGQPQGFEVVWGIGDAFEKLGRPEDAARYLSKAVDLAASSTADEETLAGLYRDLRSCYESMDRLDLAQPWGDKWAEWGERATRRGEAHEADARLHFLLGVNYDTYGRRELAAERLEAAERLGLGGWDLQFGRQIRAYALERTGRWEDAIPVWESLKEQSEDPQCIIHFAQMAAYARGRLDAKLRRRHRPGSHLPILIDRDEADRDGQIEDAGWAPQRLVDSVREHELTRLRLWQGVETILRRLELLEQTIDQRYDDVVRRAVKGREDKLKDIENELERTVFGETWVRLEASARQSLVSAQLLYQDYLGADGFDLGTIAYGFAKALEAELPLFLRPFQMWVEDAGVGEVRVGNKAIPAANVATLCLGEAWHLLRGTSRGNCPEMQQWTREQAPAAQSFLLQELPRRLPRIVGWRNRAVHPRSHPESLTSAEVAKLRTEIIGAPEEPGLLKQLVDAMTAKGST